MLWHPITWVNSQMGRNPATYYNSPMDSKSAKVQQKCSPLPNGPKPSKVQPKQEQPTTEKGEPHLRLLQSTCTAAPTTIPETTSAPTPMD